MRTIFNVYLCSINLKQYIMSSLIDRVIQEIKNDFTMGDLTALDELLSFVPRENLIGYLPEEEWDKYENEYMCDCCGGGFIKEEMVFDVNDQDLCKGCNSSIEHNNFMKYGK